MKNSSDYAVRYYDPKSTDPLGVKQSPPMNRKESVEYAARVERIGCKVIETIRFSK